VLGEPIRAFGTALNNIDLSVLDPALGPTRVTPSPLAQPLPALENTLIPALAAEYEIQTVDTSGSQWIIALAVSIIVILLVVILLRRRTAG